MWEYKPPGFFALYALATMLVPPRLAAWALGTIAILATTSALYVIGRKIERETTLAIAPWAVAFFVLLASENDAIASDVELEISAFIALAIAVAFARTSPLRRAMLAGLLAGIALQCKLTALLLVPVVFAALASGECGLLPFAAFAAAVVFPIALDLVIYASAGALPLLYDATIAASARRAGAEHGEFLRRNFGWLVGQVRILAPIVEFVPFALGIRATPAVLVAWLWAAAALAAILAAGELYQRHFVLLAAPVALVGAIGFARLRAWLHLRTSASVARAFVIASIALAFGLHDYYETVQSVRAIGARFGHKPIADLDRELVVAIVAAGGAHTTLFLAGVDPLIYDLAGARATTRFRDTEHLFDPRLSVMAGVDAPRELDAIFARRPRVVVAPFAVNDYHLANERIAVLQSRLVAEYVAYADVRGFRIYRRR